VRYFLDPFGCVKNQVDAETMMAALNRAGWEAAGDAEDADLIIVNSCGFIESAKKESLNAVFGWRKRYPRKKILLAGCLAQRYAGELAASLPEADLLFGNRDLGGIAGAAAAALGLALPEAAAAPGGGAAAAGPGRRPLLSLPGSAYVKISEGCDNRCAFCSIPLIRGPLKSRPPAEILEECRELLGRGIRELCIIGQDIGSYGADFPADRGRGESWLPRLLENIGALPGHFWVRLLYIHPDRFPGEILNLCAADPRFLPYFDLPFQHGSETILRAMNRRGNAGTYLDMVEQIRSHLPGAVIRSTFLLGFPGETEEDFQALLDFQDRARLDWAGCFTYSREEDTPAWSLPRRVPKRTAAERKRIVEERQVPISAGQMDRFVGAAAEALVEEKFEAPPEGGSGGAELYLGRLPCQAPEVDGATVIHAPCPLTPGTLVPCRIIRRAGFDLEAVPLGE
jgi:ribosomal protein S12 methylthiotransferase